MYKGHHKGSKTKQTGDWEVSPKTEKRQFAEPGVLKKGLGNYLLMNTLPPSRKEMCRKNLGESA